MTNNEKYEIQKIKDLSLIYFYDVSQTKIGRDNSSFLSLKIVYNNGKSLNYNYNDENFYEFLLQVLKVYEIEKNNNKIEFLDDFSKDFIENIDINKYNKKEESTYNVRSRKNLFSCNSDIYFISEYIKMFCLDLLKLFNCNEKIEIVNFNGFLNKFSVSYILNGTKKILPLIIKKISNSKYNFSLCYVDKEVCNINGKITIGDSYVNISWFNEKDELVGSYQYDINPLYRENVIKKNDEVLSFNEVREKVSEEEDLLLSFYIKEIFDETIENKTPTVNNNYILSDTKFYDTDEQNVKEYKKQTCHVSICDDSVNFKYCDSVGISKDKYNFLIPLIQNKKDVSLKKIKYDNKDFLILEIRKLPINSKGEVKYSYQIFEIGNFKNFNKPFNIISKCNIKNEEDEKRLIKLIR